MRDNKNVRMLKTMKETVNPSDDYTSGLYNGIEIAISVLENREPELISVTNEPSVYEAEEKLGRTTFAGYRRLSE